MFKKRVNSLNALKIMAFIIELEQRTLKCVWKHERLQIAKKILRIKNKAGSIILHDFKLVVTKLLKSKQYGVGTKKNQKKLVGDENIYPTENRLTCTHYIFLHQ